MADRVPDELVEWFSTEINQGDAPELHLSGLREAELVPCFDVIRLHAPRWNDRTFHVDAEGVDVTVAERPDVAELVASGRAAHACIGAEGMVVDGVVLPLVEMFLFRDEIQFFWWPSPDWSREGVAAFLALLTELLAVTEGGTLRPDPRYSPESRRRRAAALAAVLGPDVRLS